MSLSWRDRTSIFVAPDAVEAAARRGRFGRGATRRSRVEFSGGGDLAQEVGDALRAALAGIEPAGGDATVVVSNHYVRFALVPDAGKLRNDDERALAARHTLQAVYGDAANGWRVVLDGASGKGPAVAAGIDAALVDTIVAALKAASLRPRALRPLFACALDTARRALGNGPAWFCVAEPGRLALAYVERGMWQTLRSHRLRGGLAQELPVLLDQDRLAGAAGGGESAGRVVLASRETVPADLGTGAWTVSPVRLELAGSA